MSGRWFVNDVLQTEASRVAAMNEAKQSYEKAVEKRVAGDKVAASLDHKKKAVQPLEFEEDLDPDLAASLQRARRLAQLKVRDVRDGGSGGGGCGDEY